MYVVSIHTGPHPTEPVAATYRSIASIDQLIEGARVKCGQLPKTRGRRVFVAVNRVSGAPVTSRIFQETVPVSPATQGTAKRSPNGVRATKMYPHPLNWPNA